MKASAIVTPAAEVLQDIGFVTWTSAQLVGWLNDGQRAVAGLRAGASALTGNIDLVSGTKQALPDGGLRLLDVVRNTGVGGLAPGRAVMLVSRVSLDEADPGWHVADESAVVREFAFDDRDGRVFWVNPPSDGTVMVEALYTVSPVDCEDVVNDDIAVPDNYAPALIEWVLYRAFSRDSEETPNAVRADSHFRRFFNLLDMKLQNDMRVSPKRQGNDS